MSKVTMEEKPDEAVQVLEETTKMRRSRSRISSAAGIAILLLIVLFVLDGLSFFKTYDSEQLVQEVKDELPRLLSSTSMQKLVSDLREKVIPLYVEEISEKLNAAEPRFQAECDNAIAIMSEEIGPAVAEKLVAHLSRILEETEALVIERHPDLSDKDMEMILITLQEEIELQYVQSLGQQMKLIFGEINQTLQSIKNDTLHTELQNEDTTTLERMLLTTALELAIYEIDPKLGETL